MSEALPFAHLQRTYAVQLKIDAAPEVYTGSHDGAIHCWGFDAANNKFLLKCKLEGHVLGVTSLALFSSGGTFLLSGSMDKSVRVWSVDDPQRKECQGLLTKNNSGHTDVVTAVCALAMGDQNFFLTGSLDQHVRVWNGQGGCDFAQKCGGQVLALCTTQDPGNKAVVLVGLADGTVELRQPELGFRLRATLSNRFSVGHHSEVKALCAGDAYARPRGEMASIGPGFAMYFGVSIPTPQRRAGTVLVRPSSDRRLAGTSAPSAPTRSSWCGNGSHRCRRGSDPFSRGARARTRGLSPGGLLVG